ncbi:MAG: helix-turn-helix domain-containing protein [Mycobacterium sp.]
MTSATLSRAVSDLSAVCRRPVALNDRNMVPVASTPHEGPIDASRMELLYGRPAPSTVRDRLFAEELDSNRGPRHIAAFHGLDLGRAYVPVRAQDGDVIGHLWIIDPDRTISAGGLEDLGRTATELLTRPLNAIAPASTTDEVAAVVLQSEAHRMVVVARSAGPVFDPTGHANVSLDGVLAGADLQHRFGVDAAAAPASDSDGEVIGVVVLGGPAAALNRDRTDEALSALRREWQQHLPDTASDTLRIAVSAPRGAGQSVQHATSALKDLLRHGTDAPGPVFAEDHDSFAFLEELRAAFGDAAPLQPLSSVEPLLVSTRTREVARTVKAYLDSNDDAQQTAQKLFIHRGTLYYRINQAQRLTGLTMTGANRLRMHLGLVLAEVSGRI